MATTQPPSETPFGLAPNIAAGLAYLFGLIGGIVMLVGGGSNKFVKWCAAQSIVLSVSLWLLTMIAYFTVLLLSVAIHFLGVLLIPVSLILTLLSVGLWLWTTITGFQGQSVRVPFVADITDGIFKSIL